MNSLSNGSNTTTFNLPTNGNSNRRTYRAGTDAGDKLIAAEADCRRIKALLAKGRAATSSSGQYDVPADGEFNLSKYCVAEKLTRKHYESLTKRLRGTRKVARALSTSQNAVNLRRFHKKGNDKKVAAKKVGRKTGF